MSRKYSFYWEFDCAWDGLGELVQAIENACGHSTHQVLIDGPGPAGGNPEVKVWCAIDITDAIAKSLGPDCAEDLITKRLN